MEVKYIVEEYLKELKQLVRLSKEEIDKVNEEDKATYESLKPIDKLYFKHRANDLMLNFRKTKIRLAEANILRAHNISEIIELEEKDENYINALVNATIKKQLGGFYGSVLGQKECAEKYTKTVSQLKTLFAVMNYVATLEMDEKEKLDILNNLKQGGTNVIAPSLEEQRQEDEKFAKVVYNSKNTVNKLANKMLDRAKQNAKDEKVKNDFLANRAK